MSSTIYPSTSNSGATLPGRVDYRRLVWVGPLVIVAGMIANTMLQWLAVTILQPDPSFVPFTGIAPAVFTFFALLAAVLVYAVIGRLSKEPIRRFKQVALAVLVLSLIPDFMMVIIGFISGTTAANVFFLVLMHVVAWAIAVYGLTNFARK